MEHNEQTNEIGTISGILIIVVMFVLGGFYFWGAQAQKEKQYAAIRAENASSSDDSLNDISNDAASLNFSDLGNSVNDLK